MLGRTALGARVLGMGPTRNGLDGEEMVPRHANPSVSRIHLQGARRIPAWMKRGMIQL